MPHSWRHYLTNLLLILAIGTLIGWFYGQAERGLLVAALAALAWQASRMLSFERAIRTLNFDAFRVGEGIWQQLYSRFSYQERRARKYKRRYQKLLKEFRKSTGALPDAGIILNEAFEIVQCNAAAKELIGIRPKIDRGHRVDNILRDPLISNYLEDGKFNNTVEVQWPPEMDRWLSCRVVPYGTNQYLMLLRDVTDRRRLAVMRRDFVANASHELRSPLTVITGYLDAMDEDEGVSEIWEKPVEEMRGQAERMNLIVAELLELSRLEAAGPQREQSEVDVAAILAAARKSYAGLPDTPAIEVTIDSPARLAGSASEIESVVSNLLSNAVRHTPSDGTVTLSWRSDNDGAVIAVADTGEGIAEEHLPRLTERFFRDDSGRSRDGGGIGLGLAIVKHVLIRHDAELLITSSVGAGSEFACHFPNSRVLIESPVSIQRNSA